jgi:hypothetical protein
VGSRDAGLNAKDLHEARIIRDAERVDRGIARRESGVERYFPGPSPGALACEKLHRMFSGLAADYSASHLIQFAFRDCVGSIVCLDIRGLRVFGVGHSDLLMVVWINLHPDLASAISMFCAKGHARRVAQRNERPAVGRGIGSSNLRCQPLLLGSFNLQAMV